MNNHTDKINRRIAIVMPNKLGDAILSLPLILCLQQLAEKFGPVGTAVEAVTYLPLVEIFAAVGIENATQMNLATRLKSWLNPPDKAFFSVATSKNFAFRARNTYGLYQKNKWPVRYDHDLKCISGEPLPPELERYLADKCHLPPYSVRQFGIALKLGYTVEQIISTFTFSRQNLPVNIKLSSPEPMLTPPYLICCMEAAGGKGKHNSQRRWNTDHYLTIAKKTAEQYRCRVAFVGIAKDPPIPAEEGFLDLRGKLNLWQLFQLMSGAEGYFGNDTGPMHLANLAGSPTVGVYPAPNDHAPLFGDLNIAVIRPNGPDDVYPAVRQMIENRKH